MKLWKIYQDVNGGYDTYDSAIVVAADEGAARSIHPDDLMGWGASYCWAKTSDQVGVICIGEAAPDMEPGTVVLASFNAG